MDLQVSLAYVATNVWFPYSKFILNEFLKKYFACLPGTQVTNTSFYKI